MGGHTRIAWGTYPWSILRHLFLRGPVTGTVAIFTFMACLKIGRVILNVRIIPPNPRGGDNTEKYCPRPCGPRAIFFRIVTSSLIGGYNTDTLLLLASFSTNKFQLIWFIYIWTIWLKMKKWDKCKNRGERIVFWPPNTNTNIFGPKIKAEYEYEYIRLKNKNRIRIRIYSVQK